MSSTASTVQKRKRNDETSKPEKRSKFVEKKHVVSIIAVNVHTQDIVSIFTGPMPTSRSYEFMRFLETSTSDWKFFISSPNTEKNLETDATLISVIGRRMLNGNLNVTYAKSICVMKRGDKQRIDKAARKVISNMLQDLNGNENEIMRTNCTISKIDTNYSSIIDADMIFDKTHIGNSTQDFANMLADAGFRNMLEDYLFESDGNDDDEECHCEGECDCE
jgi:hypothetical protein